MTIASRPNSAAFMMLTRSGTLAKRHTPRYRPTRQNTSPCAHSTSSISTDIAGSGPDIGWMA